MSPVCYVDFDPEQFQPPLPFRVRLTLRPGGSPARMLTRFWRR